ncbi:MAG: hypothetical protein EOP87_00545 [Verrucomicrobiaceae bacterium]|nr:MAG: hypothetical protein EOP87_00545 [Verrucomicrobiaceae bacterium]
MKRNVIPRAALSAAAAFGFSGSPAVAASIWTEGESASPASVQRHPWWYDKVKKDLLSGGDWLSNFGPKEGTGEYALQVPGDGAYTLWIRANPLQAKLDFSVGGGPWVAVDFKETRGQQNIAEDNKPDMRFIAWVKAGVVDLKKGTTIVKFRMTSANSHHGGLDCFVLTTDPFVPQGIVRPDAVAAAGPADWFPLMPDDDRFSAESVIDLSSLNHVPAGRFGPVIADGSKLRFADGREPVKLWGVGADFSVKTPREQSLQRIKYLRKHGINYVRQHPVFDTVATDGKIDPAKLAEYDWWFAELKKAGIYSCWSVFYHFPVSARDGYPEELFNELEPLGKSGLRDTYGIIQMAPQLWDLRLKALTALLDHRNPHTGLRYADDPALATVEFQNEDCIFFWNPLGELSNPDTKKWPLHAKLLRQGFAAWVRERYKDDAGVKAAWGRFNESLDSGELTLMGPYDMDAKGIRGRLPGQTKRAGDQIRFMTEMQRGLYDKTEKAVRATGFKAQTVTTNWLGGSSLVDQANIYTDTIGSMIDRHNYAGGGAGGHNIHEGAIYADSHLGKPGKYLFSIGFKQVGDKPFSLSEWTMCPPNQWKLEAAPIMAFYGMGLQGWDAALHFAQGGSRLGDGWPGMRSYSTDTPHYMGQFPALAFAVRKGHFKEAPVVAARTAAPERLFSGTPAWAQNYYDGKTQVNSPGAVPDEMFAVGRVTVDFNGGESGQTDAGTFWDEGAKTITSATGELVWDYGRETILVKSAKTQGVIGKAAGRAINLPGVSVETSTEFVSLLFTPLDDQPLAESRHVLITALARDRQSGAKYSEDGTKLEAVGTAPLLLEPVQAVIRLKGAKPSQIRALDYQGVPKKGGITPQADGTFTIDGTSTAYYYEVKR